MVKPGNAAGYATGVTGVGLYTLDRLLEHGDLGVYTFGVLALAGMFFGFLAARNYQRSGEEDA